MPNALGIVICSKFLCNVRHFVQTHNEVTSYLLPRSVSESPNGIVCSGACKDVLQIAIKTTLFLM